MTASDARFAAPDAVWRVRRADGVPLVAGAESGPLAGRRVAVKDLFAVAGFAVGAGTPAYLAEQAPATAHAEAVATLLAAGAAVEGIAQTDEFAYSIAGVNDHWGAPPNPAAPGRVPGGSTSGPASAVALGQADIGLGTDTGGSLRVPASYQGLWGLRTTHGAVGRRGLLPLAERFDTVGWIAGDGATLRSVAAVGLAGAAPVPLPAPGFVVDEALLALAEPAVRTAFEAAVADAVDTGRIPPVTSIELGDPAARLDAFRVLQAAQAWEADGAWVDAHPGALGPAIAGRFEVASRITAAERADAQARVDAEAAHLATALEGRVLLLPAASSAAPALDADAGVIDRIRTATMRLTAVAGVGGLPGLSVPAITVTEAGEALPVGLGLVGPAGADLALIDLAMAAFPAA